METSEKVVSVKHSPPLLRIIMILTTMVCISVVLGNFYLVWDAAEKWETKQGPLLKLVAEKTYGVSYRTVQAAYKIGPVEPKFQIIESAIAISLATAFAVFWIILEMRRKYWAKWALVGLYSFGALCCLFFLVPPKPETQAGLLSCGLMLSYLLWSRKLRDYLKETTTESKPFEEDSK